MMIVKKGFRVEYDSIGELEVEKEAYYGVNALRANHNFQITGYKMDKGLIKAIVEVKKACALTNNEVDLLSDKKMEAIVAACDKILAGDYMDQFITDPIQGGAGTSFNMNANEVIANLAIEYLGGELGDYSIIHPNDDVNCGQSTNDVIPSAGKIALIRYFLELYEETCFLVDSLIYKSKEFDDYIKMGRTQLQDAIPIRLGQEFEAYATVLTRDLKRFNAAIDSLSSINLGGTAIGTGLNANVTYVKNIVPKLSEITGLDLKQNENLIDGTQNLDSFLFASSVLKTFAASLSKISNDLRLLSSGPKAGISEIQLPAKQAGSSIMPGKVNPVIPEVVNQVAFSVIGNDTTISMAVESGQLELNAFEPIIFYKLFESLKTLQGAIHTLRVNCIDGITADKKKLEQKVENSIGIITALAPYIGYQKSSQIAKKSLKTNIPIRKLVLEEGLMNEDHLDRILDLYKMTVPGIVAEELTEGA
ncbi:aspartate ammonia-lyase [Garciella nitratireducens]|uniref:aspartate ammonia-lyase n=1 Tax=Garciella nitratireducens DSM 15102 TaxID=1121911 RepID=A0A1T4L0Y8_9FIRM|nr:aspartate ammonia-lyase [Garciella nitratireducens]SJZ48365.1 aspartate ammonia-lyase [Garciella nitratireducens DSM 15102]